MGKYGAFRWPARRLACLALLPLVGPGCGKSKSNRATSTTANPATGGTGGDETDSGGAGGSVAGAGGSVGGTGGSGGTAGSDGGTGGGETNGGGEGGEGGAAGDPSAGGSVAAPETLQFTGRAEGDGEGADDRVECSFYGEILELVWSDRGFTGLAVGEVFRTIYTAGVPAEFSAFVAGEAFLSTTGEGVEVRLVGEQPDTASEFWRELEVLTGTEAEAFHYSGTWACAPILLGDPGFADLDLSVPGSWQISPKE